MNKIELGTFRGWCVFRWVYGQYEDGKIITNFVGANVYSKDRHCMSIDPNSIGKYTGITDQNDIPIYASVKLDDGSMSQGGDVIQHHYHKHPIQKSIMQYIDGHFVLGDSTSPMEFKDHDDSTFRIIGNGYEHSELLEAIEKICYN